MSPPSSFQPGGPSHLAALAVTALVAVVMFTLARRGPPAAARFAERALAVLLILEWPANALVGWSMNLLTAANGLPCHLCDVAAFIGGYALLTRNRAACELLYFWGLAATLQGLLTPALIYDWPHPRYYVFFGLHGGVVVAALYVVFALGLTPQKGGVLRAMVLLAAYTGIAALVNLAVGADSANYGFLCRKPPNPSLLDHLGPWPWYVGSLGIVALIFFTLLDLPFAARRREAAS